MESKILFSVVIPTYNRADKLKKALISLTQQTYKGFEVLVCDDGSTDNTKVIVDAFNDKLNIHYFWEPNWGGPARPRNIGIKHAKTEWICFLDADDWWYPNKLEVCLPYLNDFDVIYHGLEVSSNKETNEILPGRQVVIDNAFFDLFINRNAIPNSSVIVHKSILNAVNGISEDKNLISVEDYDCWLRISKLTNKFKHIDTNLGYYYLGDGNISVNGMNRIRIHNYLFSKYNKLLSFQNKLKALESQNLQKAEWYIEMGNVNYAVWCYIKAIKPWKLKKTYRMLHKIVDLLK